MEREKLHGRTRKFEARHGRAFAAYAAANRRYVCYQLSQKLDEFSEGLFVLQEASIYVILYRMQEKGYISASQQLVGRRRTRVYYHLEEKGKEYLKQVRKEYFSVTKGVLNVFAQVRGGLGRG